MSDKLTHSERLLLGDLARCTDQVLKLKKALAIERVANKALVEALKLSNRWLQLLIEEGIIKEDADSNYISQAVQKNLGALAKAKEQSDA
jgi:hypothetical protein